MYGNKKNMIAAACKVVSLNIEADAFPKNYKVVASVLKKVKATSLYGEYEEIVVWMHKAHYSLVYYGFASTVQDGFLSETTSPFPEIRYFDNFFDYQNWTRNTNGWKNLSQQVQEKVVTSYYQHIEKIVPKKTAPRKHVSYKI